MNRIVISVPRVLDSALVVTQDNQVQIPTGTVPSTAVAPFTVNHIQANCNETQMTNTLITPLHDASHRSRITATVNIPLTLTITDAEHNQFTTQSLITKNIDVILYIPEATAFPYSITCEGAFGYDQATATAVTTTINGAICKILVRITAITDILIPSYGYAQHRHAEVHQNSNSRNFLNQPLFPSGKIY